MLSAAADSSPLMNAGKDIARTGSKESSASEVPWTMVIRPGSNILNLRLRELWGARELIALFVWRDFISLYKQTILGPLWYIFQPLLTSVVFTAIFGRIAGLSTDGSPQFLFYMAGTVLWSYFSACLTKTSTTLVANAHLFGKVYFPRLAIPLSITVSSLIAFVIQMALFIALVVCYAWRGAPVHPNARMLLLPVHLILMAGLGLGLGIIISSLTVRYRDLQHLVTFGVQLLMYATPVIYPLSAIPERYRIYIQANPLTPIAESFRYAFLGTGSPGDARLLYSAGVTVAVLIAGGLIFNRIERTFVDMV